MLRSIHDRSAHTAWHLLVLQKRFGDACTGSQRIFTAGKIEKQKEKNYTVVACRIANQLRKKHSKTFTGTCAAHAKKELLVYHACLSRKVVRTFVTRAWQQSALVLHLTSMTQVQQWQSSWVRC